jgi:hypothetical protein
VHQRGPCASWPLSSSLDVYREDQLRCVSREPTVLYRLCGKARSIGYARPEATPPPDESAAMDEYKSDAKSSTDETPSVRRPDRAQRIADNKTVDFVTVKTTLNAFCKRGGRFLPGRVLPWEEVLADMNKGVLEAYLLANVHVLRLIEAGKDIPELNMLFFRRCLSAVMELLRNTKVEPELAQSLKIYNASQCSRSPRAKGEYINQG